MAFADAKFLPSGTYAIINVEYNRSVSFNKCFSASGVDYGCTISLLANKKWSIQGPPDVFADIGPDAEEGEDVALIKNPPKPHQWVIERHSGEAQFYIIYSPTQPDLLWSLPSGDEGASLQLSADHDSRASFWKFKKLENVDGDPQAPDPMKEFVAGPVKRPTQLDSANKNAFVVTIPAGWLTTITSVSCGNCINLVRVRRLVNSGALEKEDLISGWDTIDEAMTVDGSDSNSMALPSAEDAYVLVIEAFSSSNRARKEPRKLPGSKHPSANLRVVTTSRPNAMKSFPDFQTFTIFDESLEESSSRRTQNAIITIHASVKVAVDSNDPGKPEPDTVNEGYNQDLDSPRPLVHYRVYDDEGAIVTKRPAYLNDTYLARIQPKWVAPPHNAGSLRRCLALMESIDPNATTLFAALSSKSTLADDIPVSFKTNQTLGIAPDEPVVLLTKVKPDGGLRPGTEGRLVPPDAQSPLTPNFLYYGVYNENGASTSKAPVDPQEDWVSRVDLSLVPPPLSVASLKRSISSKEGITGLSQLFTTGDLMTAMIDDHILTEDGKWPGSTPDDHVMLKFTTQLPLPTFSEESHYKILSSTGKAWSLLSGPDPGRDLYLYDLSHQRWRDSHTLSFSLKNQNDGGIALRGKYLGRWAGPNFRAHPTEYSYYFVPTEREEWFYIFLDKTSRQAFYETQVRLNGWDFQLGVKDLNANDLLQRWHVVPV